jgi:acyl-CoA thioesterase-2
LNAALGKLMSEETLKQLLDMLNLERLEVNLFRGASPDEDRQRVFGGQVLGQALRAATHTVENMVCHSFHSYFLRAGDPTCPIIYEVDHARDGKSFSSRRVIAIQHGKQIFNLAASFQRPEKGLMHQMPMPEAPPPEDLESDLSIRERYVDRLPEAFRARFLRKRPYEMRPVTPSNMFEPKVQEPAQMVWFRATEPMPDDIDINQALLAYISDTTLLDTCLRAHGLSFLNPKLQSASLDHAMWFFHPFKVDEWILYAQDSPASAGGRGMNFGHFFTRDGKLICSAAQEGLIRVHD